MWLRRWGMRINRRPSKAVNHFPARDNNKTSKYSKKYLWCLSNMNSHNSSKINRTRWSSYSRMSRKRTNSSGKRSKWIKLGCWIQLVSITPTCSMWVIIKEKRRHRQLFIRYIMLLIMALSSWRMVEAASLTRLMKRNSELLGSLMGKPSIMHLTAPMRNY